jgi:hypothetical protein
LNHENGLILSVHTVDTLRRSAQIFPYEDLIRSLFCALGLGAFCTGATFVGETSKLHFLKGDKPSPVSAKSNFITRDRSWRTPISQAGYWKKPSATPAAIPLEPW